MVCFFCVFVWPETYFYLSLYILPRNKTETEKKPAFHFWSELNAISLQQQWIFSFVLDHFSIHIRSLLDLSKIVSVYITQVFLVCKWAKTEIKQKTKRKRKPTVCCQVVENCLLFFNVWWKPAFFLLFSQRWIKLRIGICHLRITNELKWTRIL